MTKGIFGLMLLALQFWAAGFSMQFVTGTWMQFPLVMTALGFMAGSFVFAVRAFEQDAAEGAEATARSLPNSQEPKSEASEPAPEAAHTDQGAR